MASKQSLPWSTPLLLTFSIYLVGLPFAIATSYTWSGGTGDWSVSTNWTPNGVPGSGDDIIINTGTVTLDIVATVQTISMGGGDLVLDNALTVSGDATLSSTSSEISGAGDLTVNGDLIWTNSKVSGTGAFTLVGSMNSTNATNAVLNTRSLTLSNGGTWMDFSIDLENGATLTVPSGKTLTINNPNSRDLDGPNGNAGTLVNNGVIEKSGNGVFSIEFNTLDNNGTININAGTFRFYTGSVSTHDNASVTIGSGTVMEFTGNPASTSTFTNTTINNNGTFKVNSNVTLNGTTTLNNVVEIPFGLLTLNSVQTFSTLSLTGGDLTLNASLTVTGDMTLDGAQSLIDGDGDLSIGGDFTWKVGTISGSGDVTVTGSLTGINGSSYLETKTLTLSAGGTMTNHFFTLGDNAEFIIPIGQTLTIDNSATRSFNAANGDFGTIENNGTIIKNGVGELSIVYNTFDNNGTLNVNNGTFHLTTGSTSTHDNADVAIASGATMRFSGNASFTHDFTNTTILGAGVFYVSTASSININAGSTFSPNLEMQSGTLNLNVNASIPSLKMFSSTSDLVLNANLTVTGDVELSTSNAEISGTGDLTINGTLTWSRGTISGTGAFTLNGVFTGTSGQNATLDTRNLTFNAGATWTDFEFDVYNGASVTIPSGQTLTIDNASTRSTTGTPATPGTITNDGTIIKNGAGEYVISHNNFDNNGTITINAGILNIGASANSTHDGANITIAAGTEFEISGPSTTHTFDNTAISGDGTFKFYTTTASVSINTGSSISTSIQAGTTTSTFTLNVDATIPNLDHDGANIVLNANLTILGDVDITSGTNYTVFSGPGNINIGGNLDWSGGTIEGPGSLTVGGTMTADGSNKVLDTRTLSLTAGGLITGGTFTLQNGATLTVPTGQTLTLQVAGVGGTNFVQGETLINNGTIEKTGAGSFQLRNIDIENYGAIHVNQGKLIFYRVSGTASSVHDGATIIIASGCELIFDGGNSIGSSTHDFDNTSITGPGLFKVEKYTQVNWNAGTTVSDLPISMTNGYLDINVDVTVNSLTFFVGTDGLLGGTFTTLDVTGDVTWNQSSGDIAPDNPAAITVGGVFDLTNTGSPNFSNVTITLNGGGTWTNSSCILQDNAEFIIPSGQTLTVTHVSTETVTSGTGGGTMTNNGTLVKTGTAILNINTPYTTGSGSTTDIQGGTLDLNSTFTNGGTVKGIGTINLTGATVNDYGTFSPGSSPGTLTITGDYTNELLEIEVENGTPVLFDKLIVSGTATLGGTLTVTETGNVPAGTYNILSAGSISGTFASLNLPDCYEVEIVGGNVNLNKGVTKVWDGSVGTWSTDTSWDPNGVPCYLDDVVINDGTVTLDVQPDFQTLVVNGGILATGTGNTWTIDNPFTLEVGGTLDIGAGSIMDINGDFIHDGLITGIGTIDDEDATTSGGYNVAPGNSAGKLTKKGTYCNDAMFMQIGEAGGIPELDELEVTETIELGGSLDFEQMYGTVPAGTYEFVYCNGSPDCLSGTYSAVTLPPSCMGNCTIEYSDNSASLVATAPLVYTCVWNGSNGSYSDPSNWSCGEVPPADANIVINGGQVNVGGDIAVAGMVMTGGSMVGTGNLNVENTLEWSGGTINLVGTHQVPTIILSNSPTLAAGTLTLSGNNTWTNATLTLSGTAVLKVASGAILGLTANSASSIAQGGNGSLVVEGTLLKDGTATWTVNVPFNLSGLLSIIAGILEFNSNFDYSGTVEGIAYIDLTDATVVASGNGNFAPGTSPGTLNVLGNYTNFKLNAEIEEIGGMVSYDLLEVEGNAQLGGDLVISHLGGTIPFGTYTILTCGGPGTCLTGTFTNITYPAFCNSNCQVVIDYGMGKVDFVYSAPLPVELVQFEGRTIGSNIVLSWETASEDDFFEFEVQRRSVGAFWEDIGSVEAIGRASDYTFTDTSPMRGLNHYRLRMVDNDDSFEYSKLIAVEALPLATWQVFPNPVSNELFVRFAKEESGTLVLSDWTGRLVLFQVLDGQKEVAIDLSEIVAGVYWLHFSGGGGQAIVINRR